MDYDKWIKRECRIRHQILKNSPVIRQKKSYRVCDKCGEICLCHELNCPNCNSDNITERQIADLDSEIEKRIRCIFRFQHLNKTLME